MIPLFGWLRMDNQSHYQLNTNKCTVILQTTLWLGIVCKELSRCIPISGVTTPAWPDFLWSSWCVLLTVFVTPTGLLLDCAESASRKCKSETSLLQWHFFNVPFWRLLSRPFGCSCALLRMVAVQLQSDKMLTPPPNKMWLEMKNN